MKINEALVTDLANANLIKATTIDDYFGKEHSPWYISILMAFCGWLAALFALGFFSALVMDIFANMLGLSVLGSVLIGLSYIGLKSVSKDALKNSSRNSSSNPGSSPSSALAVIEHACLAISLVGQVMLGIAIFFNGAVFGNGYDNQTVGFAVELNWLLMCLLHGALAFFMPNSVHRVVSAYIGVLCAGVLLNEIGLASIYCAALMLFITLFWLKELTLSKQVTRTRNIAYGATLALIQSAALLMYLNNTSYQEIDMIITAHPYLVEALNLVALGFLLFKLHLNYALKMHANSRVFAIAVILLFACLSFFAFGLSVSIMILCIAFAIRNKWLLGLGVFSALVNLSAFYYWLDISLFNKSLLLMGMGTMALILSFYFKQSAYFQSRMETDHE